MDSCIGYGLPVEIGNNTLKTAAQFKMSRIEIRRIGCSAWRLMATLLNQRLREERGCCDERDCGAEEERAGKRGAEEYDEA
jgi:hypothetical protein